MDNKITIIDKTFEPFIPQEKIEAAIRSVSEQLNRDYALSKTPPVFLCVLNGSIMFTAELMKHTNFNAELVSIKMTSRSGLDASETIANTMGPTASLEGKDVIICEDIVDTGNTIAALRDLVLSLGAASVKICSMLFKPEVFHHPEIKLDYVAMEVPDVFILGYGLDYYELGRNLKDIYILSK